ncbi:hypothetical protein Tco_0427460 [Tanacetum coccineum]
MEGAMNSTEFIRKLQLVCHGTNSFYDFEWPNIPSEWGLKLSAMIKPSRFSAFTFSVPFHCISFGFGHYVGLTRMVTDFIIIGTQKFNPSPLSHVEFLLIQNVLRLFDLFFLMLLQSVESYAITLSPFASDCSLNPYAMHRSLKRTVLSSLEQSRIGAEHNSVQRLIGDNQTADRSLSIRWNLNVDQTGRQSSGVDTDS